MRLFHVCAVQCNSPKMHWISKLLGKLIVNVKNEVVLPQSVAGTVNCQKHYDYPQYVQWKRKSYPKMYHKGKQLLNLSYK